MRPHRWQPTRLLCPWDSPGKNTGVGYHFLHQCIKVKRESEVAQSYPTLSDPMDCSLPGSSIHGIFQARVLEWGATAFSSILDPKSLPLDPNFLPLDPNFLSKRLLSNSLFSLLHCQIFSLESPLDCKEIHPVHPKADQSWVFIGRTNIEAETPILWPPDVKS